MKNLRNISTRNETLIFANLLKHIDKRAIENNIYVLNEASLTIIDAAFVEQFFQASVMLTGSVLCCFSLSVP